MKNLFMLFLFSFILPVSAQKPFFCEAKIKAATVYFAGADLFQQTSTTLPAGSSEVIIKGVAENILENTIQIGAPATVSILSVQFSLNDIEENNNLLNHTKNNLIKKQQDSIAILQKELEVLNNSKIATQKTIEILDKNHTLSTATVTLNVNDLIKLVDYYNLKRTTLSNAITSIIDKEIKIQEKITYLRNEIEVILNKDRVKKPNGTIVLQVMNETAGLISFDIQYYTPNATWAPFYDLKVASIKDPMQLLYKAQLSQNTGIDWKKTKLTLSSGIPNQYNQAPILQAWFLRYGYPQTHLLNNANAVRNSLNSDFKENTKFKEEITASNLNNHTVINENQLTISFEIDLLYDILSNGKTHSVAMKELKIPATYTYYSAPKINPEAYLLSEINEYSKYNLLTGMANIIFENMYVGKTQINTFETQDTLRLSMGKDKKISIKREKVVDKSGSKFLSNYKEQTFTYDITIRNNKKEAIAILVKDQYPIATENDITITLLEESNAKVNNETGILTWNLKLNPNETKKLRISYKVKHLKDKPIANL